MLQKGKYIKKKKKKNWKFYFKCSFYKLQYLPIVTIVQALPGPPRLSQTTLGKGFWFQQKGGSAHGSNLIDSLGHVAKPAGACLPAPVLYHRHSP